MKCFSLFVTFFVSFTLNGASATSEDVKAPSPLSIQTSPNKIMLQRIKRRNAHKQKLIPLDIPKGPICVYKAFYGSLSYDSYLCSIVGREAYQTLEYILASVSEDEALCKIKVAELAQHEGPLVHAEDVSYYFEKGDQQKQLVAKPKCIACEDSTCCMAGECGHMVLCEACSGKINPKKCPMCRAPVKNFLRIYSR